MPVQSVAHRPTAHSLLFTELTRRLWITRKDEKTVNSSANCGTAFNDEQQSPRLDRIFDKRNAISQESIDDTAVTVLE